MPRTPQIILLALLALAGAAEVARGQALVPQAPPATVETPPCSDPRFERGQPHVVVDSVGWVFGIPKKIILWDRRAVNHNVSPETEQSVAAYLDANGMAATKVRINEYDPIGEWRRLRQNKQVGAGWRYTVGTLNTLAYTVIPGRLFGSDDYNPYTDSVYIYSDIPCIAQEQASYAKLVHARTNPGTYAALTSLPVVQLWPEKQSKQDVIDYTLTTGTYAQQTEATHVLYAEYGAQVGSQASLFLGSNLPLTLAGAGIGHVAAHFDESTPAQPLPTPSVAELPSAGDATRR